MRGPLRSALIGSLVAVAVALPAAPASGQSGLEEVERLTRLGRTEEARAALSAWWDGDREAASRRDLQRGLWLRGRLTVDPEQAELDFQRLVVLYPSGDFTPDAILRLAQAAWALGDAEGARRHVETLERDYPRSDALERARAWMAGAGPVPGPAAPRDRPPAERPAADARAPSRPAQARAAEAAPVAYSVQLGAFAETDRAMTLFASVRGQGVDARIVRVEGSDFTHVRVGSFVQRADAVALLEELLGMGINGALIRDDRRERPVGN